MSAMSASVAASAPALTHNARQDGAPPSSAAAVPASSAMPEDYGIGRDVGIARRAVRPANSRFAAVNHDLGALVIRRKPDPVFLAA